ncbi:hypothetical protein MCOR07_001409 [Pyricularia oryzae]|nr:hypothetical protein MCOR01_011696 [Pyricularia oryzae]KAI6269941.1 hypothetical protein MCOR26_008486 [Pyricularia oryzae]KAI6333987.1 hypothetical protein MCOR29_000824 [Pyricularia oryzae]KAI6342166.1 hypothetical protein MCOR28_005562 [Pyricularia oryzae]KAI6395865.1 hypothetical protein MCOR23_006915 [Pyricularia oryzae]
MGNQPSSLQTCLRDVCAGQSGCVGYAAFNNDPLYQLTWVKPYNLDSTAAVSPIAVVRPKTVEQVAGVVKCAASNGKKVQAKSGGHSYGNYGLGGPNSTDVITIDLVNFQQFRMDNETWKATMGAGHQLGDVSKKLHDNGGRAMAHGVCPGVGIGGHATIGGLGAMSRQWGSCLDHVLEVEVVTADGKIQRASEEQNSDLFFALKGAGGSFGVITEFVMKTHPEFGKAVQYMYSFTFQSMREQWRVFKAWQDLIGDPDLDRRFGSQIIITPLGCIIEGTFYGSQDEFDATGIVGKLPSTRNSTVQVTDWMGTVVSNAEREALFVSNLASPFYSKSLGFRQQDLLSEDAIKDMFNYIADTRTGTPIWAIIFDLQGGAINDVPMNATAYAHRDKTMFYQSYAVGIPQVSSTTRSFLSGFHDRVAASIKDRDAARAVVYAGYVDPALGDAAQKSYWGSNYPALQRIKAKYDPDDVFRNYQSVRPDANAKSEEDESGSGSSPTQSGASGPQTTGESNDENLGSVSGPAWALLSLWLMVATMAPLLL